MKKFLFFILFGAILTTFWLYSSYSSALKYSLNPDSAATVSVEIPQGSSGKEIASILKEEGLIKNATAFSFYLKQREIGDQLKAGRYGFKENQTLPEIVDLLIAGKASESSVTLLEGWTAQQMADYLEEKGLTTAESFMDCVEHCTIRMKFLPGDYLEGFLYPDTYFIDYDSYSDKDFIRQMLSTFESKLSEDDWKAISESKRTLEELIIMASIVEREERLPEEKSTVAGILWNRYDVGIALGADATILYGLGRTSGTLDYNDLQLDSPYNSRKVKELPPTPISNPSIETIRATLYPEDTDYMYYLHDDAGKVYYAKTLEGHVKNKEKYLN